MTQEQKPYAERAHDAAKFIRDHWVTHGYAPSMSEIATAVGYASKSTIHELLRRMIEDGMIEAGPPGAGRTIRIRGSQITVPEAPRDRSKEM